MNFIPKIEYIELNTALANSVNFTSPPEGDPFGESLSVSSSVTKSNNGTKQTQFNYIQKKLSLEFIFQSEAVKSEVDDFLINHAFRGAKFNYFPSNDEAEYETFTIDQKGIEYGRPIPTDVLGEFEYDFKLTLERVYGV